MTQFKIGDKVKVHYVSGNAGSEYTLENPLIGVIDSISTNWNATKDNPYHVTGSPICWSEKEMLLLDA